MRPLRIVWLSSQESGVCGATSTASSAGFSLQALRERLRHRQRGEELVLDVDRVLGARDHVGEQRLDLPHLLLVPGMRGSVRAIATVARR